jgi:isopentenyl-diphosphate delta-isomerase
MTDQTTPAQAAEDERDRKAEHIHLALEGRMQMERRHFDRFVFEHCALPEIDLADVDPSTEFLGKSMAGPLLVSCMTGGTEEAERINRHLAAGAERAGVAVGVGSQRKAIEDPSMASTFQVRAGAPNAPLLGNLGAVQLNYGYGIEECRRAVGMIDADALALHLNPLQEALQPEGDGNFEGLLPKIGEVAEQLEVPVIVKEIGMGLTAEVGRQLVDAGVRILDTAGTGGTSWARIEAQRANDVEIGEIFADWGIPTPESIRQLREIPGITVIGSGGVRTGLDVARAIALGADIVGLAYPFLGAAMESADAVAARIERTLRELRIAMFCVGARDLSELRNRRLIDTTKR